MNVDEQFARKFAFFSIHFLNGRGKLPYSRYFYLIKKLELYYRILVLGRYVLNKISNVGTIIVARDLYLIRSKETLGSYLFVYDEASISDRIIA